MLLAIGQRNIKVFLGWSNTLPDTNQVKTLKLAEVSLDAPVPESHLENLKHLLSWLYGEGSKVKPVISESRDITDYLSAVVASPRAVEFLNETRNLVESFDLTDGEEVMLRKLLRVANTKLDKALGVAHRHKTADVIAEAEKCHETSGRVLKVVKE